MSATKLILTEGIPGAGKSVAAQAIARRLIDASVAARWWYEEEVGHPAYVFQDDASLRRVTDDLFSGRHERVVAAALERWGRFTGELGGSERIAVLDGTFFGYLTWTLHYLDRPPAETIAYARAVEAILAPVAPRLIYLRQRDVAATMRNVLAARGAGWAERTIAKAAGSPYGRARGLEGFGGLVRFWAEFQTLTDRLFDELALAKLRVDVAVGEWAANDEAIAAFLGLPEKRATTAGDLGRYAGAYRRPDGETARLELVDGELAVRGLPQVWPGARLIPRAGGGFQVRSLPFEVRFDEADGRVRAMRVDGPELLGGRPPAELERVE